MENELDVCAICLSPLDNDSDNYSLECNHKFHTKCIMKWFRKSNNGACPCCMDAPKSNSFYSYNYYWNNPWSCSHFIDNRYKTIKKTSKNDEKLKIKVDKVSEKEKDLSSFKKELKELKQNQEYKDFISKNKELNKKINNKENTIRKQKSNIISKYPTIMYTN